MNESTRASKKPRWGLKASIFDCQLNKAHTCFICEREIRKMAKSSKILMVLYIFIFPLSLISEDFRISTTL